MSALYCVYNGHLWKNGQYEMTSLRDNRDASVLTSYERSSITFWAVTTGTLLCRHIFGEATFSARPSIMEWNYKSNVLALTYRRFAKLSGTMLFRVPPQKAMPGIDPVNQVTTAQFGPVSPCTRATCVRFNCLGTDYALDGLRFFHIFFSCEFTCCIRIRKAKQLQYIYVVVSVGEVKIYVSATVAWTSMFPSHHEI